MSGRHGFHARMERDASMRASDALTRAELFRGLLAETDAALRQAWAIGRLPAGIVSDDLIERTRAALDGETKARPITTAEAVEMAVARIAADHPPA